MRRARFTKNSRIHDVLLDCGECRETCDPKSPIPGVPTTETVPQRSPVISVGIVHELWALVRSKEPVVRGGVVIFVFELDGARCMVNPEDGRLHSGGTYCSPPIVGDELTVLVKDKPVEPRVYLRQSNALRVLTTVKDQATSNG